MIKIIPFTEEQAKRCFRLLNSEIGNDHKNRLILYRTYPIGFRLLNSEIGNDQPIIINERNRQKVFVSLTRR